MSMILDRLLHRHRYTCPMCANHKLPVVSPRLAKAIAARLTESERKEAIQRAGRWLTENVPGVRTYLGIVGSDREYTEEERTVIVGELSSLEYTGCPFKTAKGCAIGGCMTAAEWADEGRLPPWGFLPTLLLKNLVPDLLRSLVHSNQVADAKIQGLNWRGAFPPPRDSSNQPWVSVGPPIEKKVDSDGIVPAPLPTGPDGAHR